MITLDYLPHALFPGDMYWYLKLDGITVSIWATFGAAVCRMLEMTSRQDEIINSFLN